MKSKVSEHDIEIGLQKYFLKEKRVSVSRQVYFGGKKIDIVLLTDSYVYTIEVKISDWKTALRQANLNRVGSDYAYVAMWHEEAAGAVDNIDAFVRHNVGLIVIGKKSEPYVFFTPDTKPNRRLLSISRESLIASAAGG